MRKLILLTPTIVILIFTFVLIPSPALATQLEFDPGGQLYNLGDTLTIGLYADIDELDAIWGFGFDLSFDGGTSYISGPGDGGTYLTFTGFAANDSYFETMFPAPWDDGDTIAGEVPLGNPDVWGTNTLLGTFYFEAPNSGSIGTETIYIGPAAGDYGIFGEEGLLGSTALMPNNPTASATPIPEPATLLLVSCGLVGFAGLRKKLRNI